MGILVNKQPVTTTKQAKVFKLCKNFTLTLSLPKPKKHKLSLQRISAHKTQIKLQKSLLYIFSLSLSLSLSTKSNTNPTHFTISHTHLYPTHGDPSKAPPVQVPVPLCSHSISHTHLPLLPSTEVPHHLGLLLASLPLHRSLSLRCACVWQDIATVYRRSRWQGR